MTLGNPRKKKRRPTSGDWNLDLWGGQGIERQGATRAEQLEIARDEMRRSGSGDLFDWLADQDKKRNPSTRGFTIVVRPGRGSGRSSLGRTAVTTVIGPDGTALDFDGRLTKTEAARQWRYRKARARGASIAEAQRAASSNPAARKRCIRCGAVFHGGQKSSSFCPNCRKDQGLAQLPKPRKPRRSNPAAADTPEIRYQRAVGHGERLATARKAAANPGRATGRLSPNCPTCGALVRLPNPVPPRVTCHACGSASLVRRP